MKDDTTFRTQRGTQIQIVFLDIIIEASLCAMLQAIALVQPFVTAGADHAYVNVYATLS